MPTPTADSQIAKSRIQVLVSGYYGFDNLGDELILRVLVQELTSRGIHLTVLSQDPVKTEKLLPGVTAIPRLSFLDIADALSKTHLFISGGGGLFQDITGLGSPVYYGALIGLAKFFAVPVFFWSQGLGPLSRPFSRLVTAVALRVCRGITVRDEKSLTWIGQHAGHKLKCVPEMTADPVWLLKIPEPQSDSDQNTLNIGVSLREWPQLSDEAVLQFAKFLHTVFHPAAGDAEPRPVKFMLFPFQAEQDKDPLAMLAAELRAYGETAIEWVSEAEVLDVIGQCHRFFGMRFHSLILALLAGVPVYGLVYDPKVRSLLDSLSLEGIDVEALDRLDPVVIQQYFANYQAPDLSGLKQKAARNIELLEETLDQTLHLAMG